MIESNTRIKAVVALAESRPGVAVHPDELDANLWVLNVRNGTVDLRTGRLLMQFPQDLITKIADVDFDPQATSAEWESSLQRWLPDADQRNYLQRLVGYTLCGDDSEDVLVFLHGPTRTGKSTFLQAIRGVFGGYATVSDVSAFTKRRESSGARPEIARLAGARLVLSSEVEEGQELATAQVKGLTGGDTITARNLYKDAFEFQPQFTIWIAANVLPRVPDTDAAIWERIRVVSFTEHVPEDQRDPRLRRRFGEDQQLRSAVLAWAVRGCLMWQRDGLRAPAGVLAATNRYKAEMDPLRDWLRESCVEEATAEEPYADLRLSYRTWAMDSRAKIITETEFQQRLLKRGFASEQRGNKKTRVRTGIRLRDSKGDADTRAGADG